MTSDKITFSFGRNWAAFIEKSFTQERVEIAAAHILDFLELPDLKGKYFLDVGCGSGLSSLAALRSGAARIVSFDVDPHSVRTTALLRERIGNPAHWTVLEGSALDEAFLATLDPADIVYSWGVLHHTGNMWGAIRNTARLMKPGGLFYLALYSRTARSDYWIGLKKRYNRSSSFGKKWLECHYIARHVVLPRLVRFQNPISYIARYREKRGMDFLTDVRDWLGGYPYEEASIPEVLRFCRKQLNCRIINLAQRDSMGEYLLAKD